MNGLAWMAVAVRRRLGLALVAAALAGGSVASGEVVLARPPHDTSRIVSIGGAVTEILFALGRGGDVVAVDSTSLYPAAAMSKPNVGYMRQLSAEGVLGLSPSLVIAASESGPKETLAVLSAAKVPLVLVPDHFTGEGVVEKIRVIAEAAGSERRGECLARQVNADLGALADMRERIGSAPRRVMFVLSLMNGRAMVSGTGTAAAGILALAGAANAVGDYQGYKQISDEAVIAAAPETVLVMQRPGAVITAEEVFAHPAFALTPAARDNAFVGMNGLYLLGFGPRTAQAARDLGVALYPHLASAAWKGAAGGECP